MAGNTLQGTVTHLIHDGQEEERKIAEGGLGESERGKEVEEEEGFREESYPCWTHAMTMPLAEEPWVEDTSHPNPSTVIGATRRQIPLSQDDDVLKTGQLAPWQPLCHSEFREKSSLQYLWEEPGSEANLG